MSGSVKVEAIETCHRRGSCTSTHFEAGADEEANKGYPEERLLRQVSDPERERAGTIRLHALARAPG